MELRNTKTAYGIPVVAIHWLTALTVFGLFGLGLWMTDLTYYDPWYRKAPQLHKGIGRLLFIATWLRLAWMLSNPHPSPTPHSPLWERTAARLVHCLLYLLLLALPVSGYLISTADGRGIPLFGQFEVPALPWAVERQEEIAGQIHLALAYTLVGLAVFHALAALKHHLIDRDETLRRMLGQPPRQNT